jgi:type IV pilus biogenesis/stability protein PilW
MNKKLVPLSRGVMAVIVSAHLAACSTTANRNSADSDSYQGTKDPFTLLAQNYYAIGNIPAAFENARKAVENDDNNAEAHATMGLLLMETSDNDNAAKHFARAKKLAPRDPFVLTSYGTYLCGNSLYGEADKEFLAAASSPLNRQPWVALTNAGICYERYGKYAAARERMQGALNLKADFPPARAAMKRLRAKG